MGDFELILFGVAVAYAVIATVSIIRLANSDEDEIEGEDGGPHTYQ